MSECRLANFFPAQASDVARLGARRLHRVLRCLARIGDMGLHQRNLSHPCPWQGTEPGLRNPLGHERDSLLCISCDRRAFRSLPLCLLRSDDGASVRDRSVVLP